MTPTRNPCRALSPPDLLALGVTLAAAVYLTAFVLDLRPADRTRVPSFDIYAYFYPNVVYALGALAKGHGLFWNNLQNCGQPFFANPQTALLYPPNWIFLAFGMEPALRLLVAAHLLIGGMGMYLLCRELRLGRVAALAGALAFELGSNMASLSAWMPNIAGTYAWMPLAMLCCERLLGGASVRRGIALAGVLAVQLLAGYPQVSFFTYQLIAMRTFWALVTREANPRVVLHILAGLAVAPLLAAVQILPSAEFLGVSVRSGPLSALEANVLELSWEDFRRKVAFGRPGEATTFLVIPSAVAAIGLVLSRRRSVAIAYGLASVLFASFAFDNAISALLRDLPMGSMFRSPQRFLWASGVALAVVVGFGVDAIGSLSRPRWRSLAAALAALTAGAVACLSLSASSPPPASFSMLASLYVVTAAAWLPVWRNRWGVATLVAVLVAVNLVLVARAPYLGVLANADEVLATNHAAFSFVGERLAEDQRVHIVGRNENFALRQKSASVAALPAIGDYEPLTSRRYAEFFVKLVKGASSSIWMENINQFYFFNTDVVPRNRPLLALVGARYLLVDATLAAELEEAQRFRLLRSTDHLRVYENEDALPRAFVVPQAIVIEGPRKLVNTLSSPRFSPRAVALLDEPPADGFLGTGAAIGSARILRDRSEELVLEVTASAPAFVFLSDQHYSGWEATVDGVVAPILRANYAFRLVRVPTGVSEVVFRYRPPAIRHGAVVSSVAVFACVLALILDRRRRRATGAGVGPEPPANGDLRS